MLMRTYVRHGSTSSSRRPDSSRPFVLSAMSIPDSLPRTTAVTKAGCKVFSPSPAKLMAFTPISAQSAMKSSMTCCVILDPVFSWNIACQYCYAMFLLRDFGPGIFLEHRVAVLACVVTRARQTHVDGDRRDALAALPRLDPVKMPLDLLAVEDQFAIVYLRHRSPVS